MILLQVKVILVFTECILPYASNTSDLTCTVIKQNHAFPYTTVPKDFKVHMDDLLSKLIREIATENREKAQVKQKNYYDQNTRIPDNKQGDKVWLSVRKYPVGISPKLCDKWD